MAGEKELGKEKKSWMFGYPGTQQLLWSGGGGVGGVPDHA